jgi:hypothetical protein
MKTIAAAVVIVAFASPAAAGEPSAPPPPVFSKLPIGTLTAPPSKGAPRSIAARETAPGFYVAASQFSGKIPAMHRFVTVLGDRAQAEALKPGARGPKPFPRGQTAESNGVCLAETPMDLRMMQMSMEDLNPRATEWHEFQEQVQAYPRNKENPRSGVVAVHSERFVEHDGSASIESVDAWVDPDTRGVRLIGKATLPLVPVATIGFGLRVFAGRDERPTGKKLVQFVLIPPKSAARAMRQTPVWATQGDGDVVHGGCGHLRVGLPVEELDGEHAVFRAEVQLPNAEKSAASAPKAKEESPRPDEIRVRPLAVQVSISKTTRDKEPVVSVSYGWAGRERFERTFPMPEE